MKYLLKTTFLFFGLGAFAYAGTPIQKQIPIQGVYSPRGYDSLDSSEIVVSGYLPNSCHKNPKVEVIKNDNILEVKAKALFYDSTNPFCPEAIIPFVKTIDLGVLEAGVYKVEYMAADSSKRVIDYKVREPRLGDQKNELYANIQHIEIRDSENIAVLHGHNPSDCFVLKNVRVIDNGRKTVSIMPRMEKVRDFCPLKMVPFEIEVEIPEASSAEKTLLHVRAMKGNSVNAFY